MSPWWLGPVALSGCSLLVPTPQAQLETPRLSEQGQQYYLLVNRLKTEDFDIDFTDLRLAWTHTPLYLTASDREKRALAHAYRAETQGDYDLCLNKAGEALTYNYTSMVAHNWVVRCARAQGRTDTAEFHQGLLNNLLYSVLASGDGESPETAWKVTGASELSGLLLLLTLRLEKITMSENKPNIARILAWDYLEQRERTFWADYGIPIARYRRESGNVRAELGISGPE